MKYYIFFFKNIKLLIFIQIFNHMEKLKFSCSHQAGKHGNSTLNLTLPTLQ